VREVERRAEERVGVGLGVVGVREVVDGEERVVRRMHKTKYSSARKRERRRGREEKEE